ncbi:hypothetical protein LCGC14_1610100 [marine sediment metagenome]|uniref:Uncharacterized protein n=1 Tax=marine sediment metagenome TaxID=412755 RepID=A0A0F9KPC2_9ZZZZ
MGSVEIGGSPTVPIVGTLADAAATGPVTTTDTMMAYIKQLVNIYQLADPNLDPSLLDDSPFAQLLAVDGDVSSYNDNTDSQEAISDAVAAGVAGEPVLHTAFRSEAALAVKNTNVDIMGVDAVAGTIFDLVIEFKIDNDAVATTYTPTLKMTSALAPTTFTDQKIPAVATITPAAAVGHYRYELGDIGQGLQAKLNLAQTNDGDATRIVEAVMTYRQ